MKHPVFVIISLFAIAFSLHGQTQSSVKINVTPTAYINSSVEQKMEKWLQKERYESSADYAARTSEANKTAARKQFKDEATAKYKELFIQNANWSDLQIANYDDNKQAFLIKPAACADFWMPVPRASVQEFKDGFSSFKKTNPDFYFEGDVVKFSKLTLTNSKGITYKYDMAKTANTVNIPNIPNNQALASVNWQLPSLTRLDVDRKDFKIQACIKSESQVTSVSVVVNGQITRGVMPVKNDGCDFMVNQTLTLAEGINEVKIIVENKAGQSVSDMRYMNYQPSTVEETKRRLALVVGNAAYTVSPLANPVNDATDIAAKLRSLGFEVILLTDKTKEQMDRAVDDFGRNAKGYDVALFFYAGHALQYNGRNYLMPVNADLKEERDIEYNCTSVDRALTRMEDSKCKLKIVLLDACRNNPFERSWRSGSGNGLSFMSAPTGTFIAYSTAPHRVAQDGKGRNSPYTAELLKKLDIKRLKIEDLFKQVREGVLEKTNGQQVPWEQSSITGEFFFNR